MPALLIDQPAPSASEGIKGEAELGFQYDSGLTRSAVLSSTPNPQTDCDFVTSLLYQG
jgi:hypothetical protein